LRKIIESFNDVSVFAEEIKYWLELGSQAENCFDPSKLFEDMVSILNVLGKLFTHLKHDL